MFVRQLRRCGHYFGREIENAQVMFEVMLETHDSGCGIGRRDQQALAFASDCGNDFDVRDSRDVDAIVNSGISETLYPGASRFRGVTFYESAAVKEV